MIDLRRMQLPNLRKVLPSSTLQDRDRPLSPGLLMKDMYIAYEVHIHVASDRMALAHFRFSSNNLLTYSFGLCVIRTHNTQHTTHLYLHHLSMRCLPLTRLPSSVTTAGLLAQSCGPSSGADSNTLSAFSPVTLPASRAFLQK